MKNKTDKEIKKFLNTFNYESSQPNPKFRSRLQKELLKEYKNNKSFWSFRISILSTFAFFILAGLFVYSYVPRGGSITQNKNVLNQAEKNIVYEKILKNNSKILLSKIEGGLDDSINNKSELFASIKEESTIENSEDIEFFKQSIYTRKEDGYEKCFQTKDISNKTDYYFYRVGDTEKSKSVTFNSKGELIDYTLVEKNDEKIEMIVYKGGDKGVRVIENINKEEEKLSYPVSFAKETEENAISLNNKFIDYGSYYIIERKGTIDCDNGVTDSVTNFFINKETFNLDRTEVYLEQANPENLVYSVNENKDKFDLKGVDSKIIFSFEYKAKIEDINLDQIDNFFAENDVKGLNIEIISYPTKREEE